MADKIRKPVPKNQREISISQQTPLLDNPNSAVVPLPVFANQNDPATAKNYRAEQISVKGDTEKDYTVGIGDYFNGQMGRFLREVSKRTGGTFIGR